MSDGRLSEARRREIDDLAEFISEEHCPGISIAPEMILDSKEITFCFGSYGNYFDGMLEYRTGRFHVYCNLDRVERRDSPRARFTLGHELGHYFLDEHRNALVGGKVPRHASRCEFESKNLAEVEADTFAAGLLLPKGRFKQSLKKVDRGLLGILALAKSFGASISSTAVRYVSCAPGYSVVIKWGSDGIDWHWVSREMWVAGYRGIACDLMKLPNDSATSGVLSADRSCNAGVVERGSTAAFWFPQIIAGSQKNLLLLEQAISLGRFGALTLLTAEAR